MEMTAAREERDTRDKSTYVDFRARNNVDPFSCEKKKKSGWRVWAFIQAVQSTPIVQALQCLADREKEVGLRVRFRLEKLW